MILRSPPKKMKIEITVMPVWMAGIQARKDASGDIHVGLDDSSTPCWNDGIEGFYLNWPRRLRPIFSKQVTKETKSE